MLGASDTIPTVAAMSSPVHSPRGNPPPLAKLVSSLPGETAKEMWRCLIDAVAVLLQYIPHNEKLTGEGGMDGELTNW